MSEKSLIDKLEALEVTVLCHSKETVANTLQEARHEILALRAKVRVLDSDLRKERTKAAAACDLIESCITFAGEQLLSLPSHEHNDPVLKRMEVDLEVFVDDTQEILETLRGEL